MTIDRKPSTTPAVIAFVRTFRSRFAGTGNPGHYRGSRRNELSQALACPISKCSFTRTSGLELFRRVEADKSNARAIAHANRVAVGDREGLSLKIGR